MSFPKGRVRVENDPKDQTKYHVHSVCSGECICIMAIVRVLMKKLSLRSGKFIDIICLIFLKPLRRASLFSHDIANKQMCVFTDTFSPRQFSRRLQVPMFQSRPSAVSGRPPSPGHRLSAGVCPNSTFFLRRQWDQCAPSTLPSMNHTCTCTHTHAHAHRQPAVPSRVRPCFSSSWPRPSSLRSHSFSQLLTLPPSSPHLGSVPSRTSAPSGLRHSPS